MRTLIGSLAAVIALNGCITQRSLSFSQLAAPVGSGGADLAVSTGVMYSQQTAPPSPGTDPAGNPTSSQVQSSAVAAPWIEANGQYGFTRQIALNVHVSPAGIQPGLKWTLNRSLVAHVALLPEIGVGYAQHNMSTYVADASGAQQEYSPGYVTSFLFQAGLKLLFSHRSGFYGGLGYDFLTTRSLQVQNVGPPNSTSQNRTLTVSYQHQLAVGVGFSAQLGMISFRPEVAFAVVPAISGNQNVAVNGMGQSLVNSSGGFSWAILPSFAFALTTPANEKVEVEEKPTTDPEEREGKDDNDDDDNAKKRRRQQEDE